MIVKNMPIAVPSTTLSMDTNMALQKSDDLMTYLYASVVKSLGHNHTSPAVALDGELRDTAKTLMRGIKHRDAAKNRIIWLKMVNIL